MPVNWPTNPKSQRLRRSDPVHYLFSRLLELKQDLDLKDHLIRVVVPYLKTTEANDRSFSNRALIASGLFCYCQSVRLQLEIEKETPGSEQYEIKSRHCRAYIETLAKAYRLKGMYEPAKRRKPEKEGRRIPVSATIGPAEEPVYGLEEVGGEA